MSGPLPAPALDLLLKFEGTRERTGRRVWLKADGAEGRHETIAQVLVEGAAMLKHDGAAPLLEAPQQGERALGREGLGELGEADDVCKQDGHRPCRRLSERSPAAPGKRLDHVRRDIAREIRPHDLGLDLVQQGPPAAPDGECDEQGEQGGCNKLGIPGRQADKGRLEGEIQGRGRRERALRSRIVEPQRVRLGVDREDTDRPDDEDRHARPEHPPRGVGERSFSEEKENVEEFLATQAGLDGPVAAKSGRRWKQDRGRHQGHVEDDEAKLDRLAMRAVAQEVRNVTQEEEPEGVRAVVEVARPWHEPDEPDGNDSNGRQPSVEGELEPFKFSLLNAPL